MIADVEAVSRVRALGRSVRQRSWSCRSPTSARFSHRTTWIDDIRAGSPTHIGRYAKAFYVSLPIIPRRGQKTEMEAVKLKTVDDLLRSPEERVELIGSDIVRRPMTGFANARAQGSTRGALHRLTQDGGPGATGGS